MYKFCVFAGTTEGRELAEFLRTQAVTTHVCVATQYGGTLLAQGENLLVHAARMDCAQMCAFFAQERFDLVIDATHPYASVVTENIASACAQTDTQYQRLLRGGTQENADAVFVADISEAVAYLNRAEGNILLTTGSKELIKFTSVSRFSERVWARVLPLDASLTLCAEAGVAPAHIIAMQGPFSQEMNIATMRAIHAKFLVTKDSGDIGGFEEKRAAARAVGATLVCIGRPAQREGLTYADTLSLLCERFALKRRPRVAIVGIGAGGRGSLTYEAHDALSRASCIIGAERMVTSVAEAGQAVYHAIAPEKIAAFIREDTRHASFAVAMSGDVGFFSGTKKLLPLLSDCDVTVIAGISSMAYLCAKLGTSYEDVLPVSVHGRERDICADVRENRRIFALVGGENGMGVLCESLCAGGLSDVRVCIGERLSYPEERIHIGTAREFSAQKFDSLSVALIENEFADAPATHGLADEAFLRVERVPMTKSEVRSVCISKLALTERSVAWDIGAGSGSVAIEMALRLKHGAVWAIERKDDALALLRENVARFGVHNLTCVAGTAPEACAPLPAPTHAFIGGSSGNMHEIITMLLEKNPNVRIVATAISLESVAELTACLKDFSFSQTEVVCMNVARSRKAGAYQLMMGQNPIYIFMMQGGNAR